MKTFAACRQFPNKTNFTRAATIVHKTLLALAFILTSVFSQHLLAEPTVLLIDQPSVVLRGGLTNARVRFEKDKSGRVAFLGGSITASGGWRDLVGQSLKKRFPDTKFDLINAGIPSLGSTPGAFRFERDAWNRGPVDLLFIDAAVNDQSNGFSAVEQVRGMEGIIRHARLLNPKIDIVMLHFATDDMMPLYTKEKTPEVIVNHERVATAYGVPTVDMPREMARAIAAKEYTAAQWGGIHPSPFGHAVYAKNIDKLFDLAWAGPLAADASLKAQTLPEPVDAKSYFNGRYVAVDAAKLGDGWTLDPAWKPNDKLETRGGFVGVPTLVATQPGATLTFTFDGPSVGIFVTSGPDAGIVEFSIDGGPFRSRDLFTGWSRSLHLPWAVMLDGDLKPGPHELRLRPAATHHANGSGTAVRIVHFLVNSPIKP